MARRKVNQANRGKWLEGLIRWQWALNKCALYKIENVIKQHGGHYWREKTPFDYTGTIPGPMKHALSIVFDSKSAQDGVIWAGGHDYDTALKYHQAIALHQWHEAGAVSGVILGSKDEAFWVPIMVLLDDMIKHGKYRAVDGRHVYLGSMSEKWDLSQLVWMHSRFTETVSSKVNPTQVKWIEVK